MTHKIKHVFAALLCLTMTLSSVSVFAEADYYVTVYSPDGETAVIYTAQLEAYTMMGWSTSPFITVYSLDGATLTIPMHEADSYKALGWYSIEVTKIYSPDGSEAIIPTSEAEVYLNLGWYPFPVTKLYSSTGEAIVVSTKEVDSYVALGWSADASDVQVKLYSADGRSISVFEHQVESYLQVGWYKPITVYRDVDTSLEEKQILPYELDSYLAEGWRTHPNASFAGVKNLYDQYISVSDYSAALALALYYINMGTFVGTGCEDDLNTLYSHAYSLWQSTASSPIGFVGVGVYQNATSTLVSVSLYNLTDKDVQSFEVEYTVYGADATLLQSLRMPVEILFNSNSLRGFTWSFAQEYNITSAGNVRIAKVVFTDGTVWSAY